MMRPFILFLVFLWTACSSPEANRPSTGRIGLHAQSLPIPSFYGRVVCSIDDCNDDGIRDYVVGVPFRHGYAGAIQAFSGSDGKLLFEIESAVPRGFLGRLAICRIGDLDNDSYGDIAVDMPGQVDLVQIISLGRRQRLVTLENERADCLVVALDLDRDGIRDIVSCAKLVPVAYSGATGRPIAASRLYSMRGLTLARVATVSPTAKLMAVLATSDSTVAFYDCINSLETPVYEAAYQVSNSPIIKRMIQGEQGPVLLAADIDRDGVLDIIEYRRTRLEASSGAVFEMRLSTLSSGVDGFALEWPVDEEPPPCLSRSIAFIDDLDGDQVYDLVVGDPSSIYFVGGVAAMSTKDGHEIWRLTSRRVTAEYSGDYTLPTGTSIDVMQDMNGDGISEIVVGCGGYRTTLDDHEPDGEILIVSGRRGAQLFARPEAGLSILR
jgi:hypothetical protein